MAALATVDRTAESLVAFFGALECLALTGASRRWEAALGRERLEVWRRYLVCPGHLACPVLADPAALARLEVVHPLNLRLVVRELAGPGWAGRFASLCRRVELGRLRAAAPRGGCAAALRASGPGKRPRPLSTVDAAVLEAKRRRMSIAQRRDPAADGPVTEAQLVARLRFLERAVDELEARASDVVGEVIRGVLLPIKRDERDREVGADRVQGALWMLRKLKPTAEVLRETRAGGALEAVQRALAAAGFERSGALAGACAALLEDWCATLAEDSLRRQLSRTAVGTAARWKVPVGQQRPRRLRSAPPKARLLQV